MPYFRKRTFPGVRGRLRGPAVIEASNARFQNGSDEWYPGIALRYENTFGNWDIGLAQFHGLNREPLFQFSGAGPIIPFYEVMNQTSLDAQYTYDAWLWKLEALYRSSDSDDFAAFSAGVEYSFYDIWESGHDIGLLAEFHFDDRSRTAPPVIFEREIFLGTRYVLNNVSDTEFLGGVIRGLNDDEYSLFFEFSHRLHQNLTLDVEIRIFNDFEPTSPFRFIEREDFAQLSLTYYF